MRRVARHRTKAPSSAAIISMISPRASASDTPPPRAGRSQGDPVVEDLGTGLAQYFAAVRDLEGDGGDRTGVGVVRRHQVVGGAGEEGAHPAHQIRRLLQHGREEFGVFGAGPADGLGAELLLAAREEVVDRPERSPCGGDDRLDPGRFVALMTHQMGTGIDDPLSGPVHPVSLSFALTTDDLKLL